MQTIFRQIQQLVNEAQGLAVEAQIVADALFEHNPELKNQDKVPIDVIGPDIATLISNYNRLRTDINKIEFEKD